MKIFIAVTEKAKTGGGESMHQLASMLNDMGREAYIYYFDNAKRTEPVEELRHYNIRVANRIEDAPENTLIVPELYTRVMRHYRRIRKMIWWLSLEYYFQSLPADTAKRILKKRKLPAIFYPAVLLLTPLKTQASWQNYRPGELADVDFHFYNCEYERAYLERLGVPAEHMLYLCGPVDDIFLEAEPAEKEDIVLFNPSKADAFTYRVIERIREKNPDVQIIPLKGMNKYELRDLYCRSKLYMDFGLFPGPERMPREAVCCCCNIITSKTGSAGNSVDVPIPGKYKLDAVEKNVDTAAGRILAMLRDYERERGDFDGYREKAREQKRLLHDNVEKMFGIPQRET